jgi:RNase P/RNase MRP subunit POP5
VFPIVKGRRYRYIFFSCQGGKLPVTFKDIDEMIRHWALDDEELCFPKRIRLMQFNGRAGIIRCAHLDQKKVTDGITRLTLRKAGKSYGFSTHGCSGTLRALRRKYSIDREQNDGND